MADPTFQQLRVFLVVAEELNFARAATRLHMAQPPVSRHVKGLETALGVPLFERTNRGVTLTPNGALVRRGAQALLRRWDEMKDEVTEVSARPIRRIALGSIESMALEALPAAIGEMRSRHRDVAWELGEGHTTELIDALQSERYDAVLLRAPIPDDDYETAHVYDDELVAALPATHPITATTIPLTALASEDFIVYSRRAGAGLLQVMIAACEQARFVPRIRHEALGTELLLGLVAAGDGVAMVSEVVTHRNHPGVRFARFEGRPAVSPIVLAWRPDLSRALMTELGDRLSRAARATSR